MMKKILKLFVMLLLFAGVVTYIFFALFNKPKTAETEMCKEISLKVIENPRAYFINERNIAELLKKKGLNPVGKRMSEVNLDKMEEAIRKSIYVDSVECYKTGNGTVCVIAKQRTPVMYILPDSTTGYYIDEKGEIIENTNYASNVLVATGDITKEYARTKLVDFGNFLLQDTFWDNQIVQLNVTKSRGKDHVVELIPRVGEGTIYLGKIDDFEKKLKRMKVFYAKAMPSIGWDKYSAFNLEYPNQIVCTKKR